MILRHKRFKVILSSVSVCGTLAQTFPTNYPPYLSASKHVSHHQRLPTPLNFSSKLMNKENRCARQKRKRKVVMAVVTTR